jgi:hypothetical protein
MGKKKSAVAARKTAGLARLLMKRREYYRGMSDESLAKKPRYYKIKSWRKRRSLLDKIT